MPAEIVHGRLGVSCAEHIRGPARPTPVGLLSPPPYLPPQPAASPVAELPGPSPAAGLFDQERFQHTLSQQPAMTTPGLSQSQSTITTVPCHSSATRRSAGTDSESSANLLKSQFCTAKSFLQDIKTES